MIKADSLSAIAAAALAGAADVVKPNSHLPDVATMGPSSPVVDTAQSFGSLLLPLLEKVKPFCDLMTEVSKVSNEVLPAFLRYR